MFSQLPTSFLKIFPKLLISSTFFEYTYIIISEPSNYFSSNTSSVQYSSSIREIDNRWSASLPSNTPLNPIKPFNDSNNPNDSNLFEGSAQFFLHASGRGEEEAGRSGYAVYRVRARRNARARDRERARVGRETRVNPLIAHGPFMGSARGSGRARAFSCGIERACGCPRCLICTEASGFSHFRPNCTHHRAHHPVRGPRRGLAWNKVVGGGDGRLRYF